MRTRPCSRKERFAISNGSRRKKKDKYRVALRLSPAEEKALRLQARKLNVSPSNFLRITMFEYTRPKLQPGYVWNEKGITQMDDGSVLQGCYVKRSHHDDENKSILALIQEMAE